MPLRTLPCALGLLSLGLLSAALVACEPEPEPATELAPPAPEPEPEPEPVRPLLQGEFEHVAIGGNFGCAFDDAHRPTCWGGELENGPERLETASSGAGRICGVTPAGELDCFGNTNLPGLPRGRFRHFATAAHRGCGLTTAGRVRCANDRGLDRKTRELRGVTRIALAPNLLIAQTPEGQRCLLETTPSGAARARGGGQAPRTWGATPCPEGLEGFSSGNPIVALDAEARLVVVEAAGGRRPQVRVLIEGVPFVRAFGGRQGGCGLTEEGALHCRGSHGVEDVPPGTYRQASLSLDHACGVRLDGSVLCWGSEAPRPPSD